MGFECLDLTDPLLLIVVGCTGADGEWAVCWNLGEGLAMARMMRCDALGNRVGFGGGSGDGAAYRLPNLLPGFGGLHQNSGIPLELETAPSCFAGAEMGGEGTRDVPWGSGSGGWGSSPGRPVTYLFFQLVWALPVPLGVCSSNWCRLCPCLSVSQSCGGRAVGRMMRWVGLDGRVGLRGGVGTEFTGGGGGPV